MGYRGMTYPTHLIPTTVVGGYPHPQPDWLVDSLTLRGATEQDHGPPAHGVGEVPAGLVQDIRHVRHPFRGLPH